MPDGIVVSFTRAAESEAPSRGSPFERVQAKSRQAVNLSPPQSANNSSREEQRRNK